MSLFSRSIRRGLPRPILKCNLRALSTLENNPYIYIMRDTRSLDNTTTLLSLLPNEPSTPDLALGTTSALPPTSSSLRENPKFLSILQSVMAQHAHQDPDVKSQAQMMASSSGSSLGSLRSGNAAGGASDQGGMGSAGRGGWIHVSDQRNPPSYGRIAEPEDIFGSLEVDGAGRFVDDHGRYQASGTYRLVTKEGILGLSPFLREKLLQRLRVEEASMKN